MGDIKHMYSLSHGVLIQLKRLTTTICIKSKSVDRHRKQTSDAS